MRNILQRPQRTLLEEFLRSNVALVFDYDGTLAPIVADPMRAQLRATTRRLLARLAARHRVAVISGRARADVARFLDGIDVRLVIGNHGADWDGRPPDERMRARVHRWRLALDERLRGLGGVVIEDKTWSLAVHYRRSRQKRTARAAIARALQPLVGARVVPGKLVVNVLPEGAPHKGIALARARERLGCDTAVYVGDDVTDEDVFALDEPGQLLTIRVGRSASSAAMYYIPAQRDMDELLSILNEARVGRAAALGAG